MINTDKMKMAYAATPLCQHAWTQKDGSNPTTLCAISAMVAFAGVQPDLIHAMDVALTGDRFVRQFLLPIIEAEYGVPREIARLIPKVFDEAENEWRGVQEVLQMCERYNAAEQYDEAVAEDAARFPQHTCEPVGLIALANAYVTYGVDWGQNGAYMITESGSFAWSADSGIAGMHIAAPPEKVVTLPTQKVGKSKFWTAAPTPKITKSLALK